MKELQVLNARITKKYEPMEEMKAGERLLLVAQRLGMNQASLAELLGVSQATISRWVEVKMFTVKQLTRLRLLESDYDVNIEFLRTGKENIFKSDSKKTVDLQEKKEMKLAKESRIDEAFAKDAIYNLFMEKETERKAKEAERKEKELEREKRKQLQSEKDRLSKELEEMRKKLAELEQRFGNKNKGK